MQSPTHFGYVGTNQSGAPIGGLVAKFTSVLALKIGDAVYVSAANSVTKDTVAGSRLKRAGIVVGGDLTNGEVVTEGDTARVGTVCSTAVTGYVLVCYSGIAYAMTGAAAIAAGAQVMFDATVAGQVLSATPTTDAGKIVGLAFQAGTNPGDVIKIIVALA